MKLSKYKEIIYVIDAYIKTQSDKLEDKIEITELFFKKFDIRYSRAQIEEYIKAVD